jgi:hypothetical protein
MHPVVAPNTFSDPSPPFGPSGQRLAIIDSMPSVASDISGSVFL